MARDEAKFRVRLDTRPAQASLRGLMREAGRTAGRVGSGVRRAVGRGLGMVGLGGAFGVGLSAVRAPVESGLGDVLGAIFEPWGVKLEEWAFGEYNEKARAARSARQSVLENFSYRIGIEGESAIPAAKEYWSQLNSINTVRELGRERIRKDEFFYGGVDPEDVISRLVDQFSKLISNGFTTLGNRIAEAVR